MFTTVSMKMINRVQEVRDIVKKATGDDIVISVASNHRIAFTINRELTIGELESLKQKLVLFTKDKWEAKIDICD